MKKFGKALLLSLLISSMFATTVFATPTSQLKEDKKKAQKELDALEDKMTSLMSKINNAEIELVKTGQAIIKAEEDLEKAEKKEKKQYEAMKHRIVAMYENGSGSMVAKIFEADSFADMVKQAENVQTIHEYDRAQLEEFVKNKEKIEKLKASLEKDMKEIEKRQKKYEQDKQDLNVMISQAEDKVDNLSARIQSAASSASGGSS